MDDLSDPTSAALLCAEALDGAGLRYAFYGGLVLAAYGEARETHDVDIAVIDLSAETARQALESRGVSCLVPFDDVVFGGLSLGRVTLLGGEDHWLSGGHRLLGFDSSMAAARFFSPARSTSSSTPSAIRTKPLIQKKSPGTTSVEYLSRHRLVSFIASM